MVSRTDGLATKPATESGLPYFTNLRRLIEGTVGSNGQPAMLVARPDPGASSASRWSEN